MMRISLFAFVFLSINIARVLSGIPEAKLRFGSTWGERFCSGGQISLPTTLVSEYPNVIIGMATGPSYTSDKVIPFCKSARSSGFRGKVVIGVSKLKGRGEKKRAHMFEKFNITAVHLESLKGAEWGQSICRYYAYLLLILSHASESDTVLLSDVRDVFFQDDPFLSYPFGSVNFINSTTQLLLFSEGLNDISRKQATLRNTKGNFRWIKNIYGYKISNLFGDNPVLCSGTTMGTKSGMVYYTRAMLYEAHLCLRRNANKFDGKRGHVCSGGADQGFHNYLYWNNKLNASVALLNAAGPVYTIGVFRDKPVRSLNFERNALGDVISPRERGLQSPVPVIHQWDRHSDLLEHVFTRFNLSSEGVSKGIFSSHLLDGSFSGKVPRNVRGM